MAGDSILIRRKDVIAGKGIAIEPSGVSAAIRIINTEVDSERLLPVNPAINAIPIYKQMDAEGNGEDVKLLIQSPATASQVADTAAGVVTHATVTAHGSLGVDDHGLLFDGNTYLEIDKNNVQSILTGSNPWCFDLYITGSEEVTSSYVQIGSLFADNNDYVINWGMIDGKVNAVNIPAWGTIEGFTAGEPHLLTIEHYINAGASTIALYCDNVRRSVISNVILPTVNENLWIGKGPVGYFKGWLDYIRIRNTAPYQSSTITPDPTPYLAAGERWTVINLSEIEGGGGTTPTDVDWNDIQNKPSTFPPSAHTHIISDVTGLSDVAVKAHTHENKTTLDKFGEVNNKPTFNGEEIGSGVSSWNDLEDKPTTFPPSEHTHQIADVSGLQDSLDSKVSSVNGQTGTVTIPNATATEAGLMSAADKSKLDGIDTTGSTGDMLKSVYDTNNDGIVDHAAVADAIGTATAAQVETAVSQSHTHENKTTLDKLGETDGALTYDGVAVGGGGGSGASSLADLSDTANIAKATDNQVLTYNATSGKWEPADAAGIDARDSIQFTASDLTESNKLVVSNTTVGSLAILDENLKQVQPDLQQVAGNVEVDFTGWTISGTWTVVFVQGSGSGTGGTVGSVSWTDLIGKPSTFPPSAHTQDQSTINGLTDALATKLTTPAGGTTGQVLTKTADSATWSNPAGDMLKSEYDADDDGTVDNANLALFAQNVGTSPENSKSYSQVSSAVELMHEHSNMSVLNGIGVSSNQLTYNGSAVGGTPSWNNVTDKPDSFTPSAHTHAIADVTGLSDALEAAGTVKSVNGNNPNASGAVTIPTATTSAAGLMSASDKTKLDGLSGTAGTVTSVNGIEPDSAGAVTLYTRTVASNENVNSVDTPGTYYVDAGAGGLPSNGTAGGAYMMTVIRTESDGYVVQILNALYNPNVQYMRSRQGSSASWRAWSSPLDAIQGYTDLTTNYMSGWFWGSVTSGTPTGASTTDQMLIARVNAENHSTINVQLAFDYTNGSMYMRRHTSDTWVTMGVNGMYTMGGSVDMPANAAESENITKTLQIISITSVVATIDFTGSTVNWNELTSAPVVYVSHNTFAHNAGSSTGTLTLRFRVINPPAKAYKINWMLTGTFTE
nr:MAG TPA: minor tail protein [Herelleviridae sp.]